MAPSKWRLGWESPLGWNLKPRSPAGEARGPPPEPCTASAPETCRDAGSPAGKGFETRVGSSMNSTAGVAVVGRR